MSAARIKNWDQFQHYKSGKNASKRPEWIRLYTRLLDDIEFHELSGDDAKVLVMLWALASEQDGELPDTKTIAFRLRLPEQKVRQILGRLSHWLESEDGVSYDAPRTEEKREEENRGEESKTRAREVDREFLETFWPEYPHKVGKPDALKAFVSARKAAELDEIMAGLRRYTAAKPDDQKWCNPATFLRQQRWLDEPAPPANGHGPPAKNIRRDGDDYVISKGCEQFEAWQRKFRIMNDPRIYSDEIRVPSMWPRSA